MQTWSKKCFNKIMILKIIEFSFFLTAILKFFEYIKTCLADQLTLFIVFIFFLFSYKNKYFLDLNVQLKQNI